MAGTPPTAITYSPITQSMPMNLNLAEDYFDTLPENDINRQYYNGLQYKPVCGCLNNILNMGSAHGKMATLGKFYPYHPYVQNTLKEIRENLKTNMERGLLFTGASWFLIYQLGRRGRVVPVLREYGYLFQTHRIFRQYLYALIVPPIIAHDVNAMRYYPAVEQMWSVHANRLNKKILSDPAGTEYPENLKARKRAIFNTPYI